jgi:hypothetical protein
MPLQQVFAWLTVVFAVAAAALWFGSTVVKVDAARAARAARDESGWAPAQLIYGEADVVLTAALQTRWNRWAAAASAVAALCQAAYTALS